MQVVYFSEELSARAPETVGCLCAAPSGEWVTLLDIVSAIRRRETVSIRPASEREMQRAEGYVALYEIGMLLAEKMESLLDQEASDIAARTTTAIMDAIGSIDVELPAILDCERG